MDDTRAFGTLRPRTGGAADDAGVIADSIVNLCGAIGLGVAMVALYRRDPSSPLTRRLLVVLGVVAVLFFTRGMAWWTGSVWLDRLSLIPAALIPLGALIVTEGILRRHAPRAAKIAAVTGAILLGLGGAFGLETFCDALCDRAVAVPARGICDLRLAAGDARPQHAAGVREPQHRPARRRRAPRDSLHRHRFPGAGAGYSGPARRARRVAGRHRGPDRGRRRARRGGKAS